MTPTAGAGAGVGGGAGGGSGSLSGSAVAVAGGSAPGSGSAVAVSRTMLTPPRTSGGGSGPSAAASLSWLTEHPAIDERSDALVIAAFELPFKVVADDSGALRVERQKSLLLPLLHGLRASVRVPVKFIGWSGYFARDEAEGIQVEQLLAANDCVPVHMTPHQVNTFSTFCHAVLRPMLHNIVALDAASTQRFSDAQWQVYQSVNRMFADAIVFQAQETDLLWIHDYYLLLCPQYITRRIRNANVGIFLHTPFPSSEVFRCLPVREELLRGMLCADLIGFHFFEYARNFLVSIKRLLGLEHHFKLGGYVAVDYAGREVMLKIGHAHIQYDALRAHLESGDSLALAAAEIRRRHQERFLFISVDRCERLAGILLKLRGFQYYLRNYPYAARRVCLLIYAYPTLHAWETPAEYAQELEATAAAINAEFYAQADGVHVVHLYIETVDAELKYALFRAADCFLDTAVRDGLNLNPFEYICCHKDDPAPLILSELTGCSSSLASAIRVNPWKLSDTAQALDRAVNTPAEELRVRFLRDQTFLQRNSALGWVDDFVLDLRRARKRDDLVYVSWGFGKSFRMIGLDRSFRYFDTDVAVAAFRRARQAAFFLDHEGTLAVDKRQIAAVPGYEALSGAGSAPSPRVLACLQTLVAAGHAVTILSGRDCASLDAWFGAVRGLGLCAEHGYYYRLPHCGGEGLPPTGSDACISIDSGRASCGAVSENTAGTAGAAAAAGAAGGGGGGVGGGACNSCGGSGGGSAGGGAGGACRSCGGFAAGAGGAGGGAGGGSSCFGPGSAGGAVGGCASGFAVGAPTAAAAAAAPSWRCMSTRDEQDFAWKEIALELMKQYVKRTQGAFIENKGSALVFQYRDADPDFGSWQAKELSNYLEELLFNFPVTVVAGKGYVEAKLKDVSKGAAVQRLLAEISGALGDRAPIDFVLCVGDDRSDEGMFPVVDGFFGKGGPTSRESGAAAAEGGGGAAFAGGAGGAGGGPAFGAGGPGLRPPSASALHLSRSAVCASSTDSVATAGGGGGGGNGSARHSDGPSRPSLGGLATRGGGASTNLMRLAGGADDGGGAAPARFRRESSGEGGPQLPLAFTVTVGKKPSSAKFYLNDVEDVTDLLVALTREGHMHAR